MSWINKLFEIINVGKISNQKIDYTLITKDWNADPVLPEIELKVDGIDLIMDIYLNHFQFDQFKEGDKVKIRFKNCAEYSLNACNDEGYYYGQYRIKPKELQWGEFYEIKSGLDRNLPNPVKKIQKNNSNRKHFIFFFKDETFECLASDFDLEFYNEKKLNRNQKTYKVVLEGIEIGTSKLEKSDAPMGVVFGLIEFNGIENPYKFLKEYCLKHHVINNDDPKFEFIDTKAISELKVFRQDGIEIKGDFGNTISGIKDEGYEILIGGIPYPFYAEEFPHHVEHYNNLFNEE